MHTNFTSQITLETNSQNILVSLYDRNSIRPNILDANFLLRSAITKLSSIKVVSDGLEEYFNPVIEIFEDSDLLFRGVSIFKSRYGNKFVLRKCQFTPIRSRNFDLRNMIKSSYYFISEIQYEYHAKKLLRFVSSLKFFDTRGSIHTTIILNDDRTTFTHLERYFKRNSKLYGIFEDIFDLPSQFDLKNEIESVELAYSVSFYDLFRIMTQFPDK
jgi:hypothetical protein